MKNSTTQTIIPSRKIFVEISSILDPKRNHSFTGPDRDFSQNADLVISPGHIESVSIKTVEVYIEILDRNRSLRRPLFKFLANQFKRHHEIKHYQLPYIAKLIAIIYFQCAGYVIKKIGPMQTIFCRSNHNLRF